MTLDVEREVAAIAAIDATASILEVVCRTTGMGFAAIARVTENRWLACAVRDEIAFGLKPGGELEIGSTICNEIRQHGEAVMIDHVAEHALFSGHPTPERYGFQSYVSVPIRRANGEFYGTLCAIDPRPAKVNTPAMRGMFTLFADLIGLHLDTQEKLEASRAALLDEREKAELREQFIAVLGHDLRNPLASIEAGAATLARADLDDRSRTIVSLIQGSTRRMASLIGDILDLARGRLGGGLMLQRAAHDLGPLLRQVTDELRAAWPDRRIEESFDAPGAIECDAARIGQLASNLIGNALTHGAADIPVRIETRMRDGRFELTVANGGAPIPPETLDQLFMPFFRQGGRGATQGLGLGLYIASEIARAHDGTLRGESAEETRFTFSMPARVR